jgi:hypothetical protein
LMMADFMESSSRFLLIGNAPPRWRLETAPLPIWVEKPGCDTASVHALAV